ncbi:MAG: diaminopimelate epimerase [Dehalococcoidia bacterium]|nr:MAG: diaminopimelate epimerase [Dehalococcoidia bacterium]
MNFTKMQGSGNDFIMIETSDTQCNWSPMAIAMCNRHFGIGSDGLILVLPSDKADFKMRMFDPDGSEAEACGNGIMCLAKLVFEKGLASLEADQILVETIAGIRQLKLNKKEGKLISIQAGMGAPRFGADDIPVVLEPGSEKIVYLKSMLSYPVTLDGTDLLLNFVSMGNPHAVYFSALPVSDFPLSQLGPKIEHLAIFPKRTNFEVARVINRQQIEVRVWERGVGETLACGSGACAVAVAAQLHGHVGSKVDIKLPGGILQVAWDGRGEVLMSGPAEIVFTGEWPE